MTAALQQQALASVKARPATAREVARALGVNERKATQVLSRMKMAGVLAAKEVTPRRRRPFNMRGPSVYSWAGKELPASAAQSNNGEIEE